MHMTCHAMYDLEAALLIQLLVLKVDKTAHDSCNFITRMRLSV